MNWNRLYLHYLHLDYCSHLCCYNHVTWPSEPSNIQMKSTIWLSRDTISCISSFTIQHGLNSIIMLPKITNQCFNTLRYYHMGQSWTRICRLLDCFIYSMKHGNLHISFFCIAFLLLPVFFAKLQWYCWYFHCI